MGFVELPQQAPSRLHREPGQAVQEHLLGEHYFSSGRYQRDGW
jgi:hypothetical protein